MEDLTGGFFDCAGTPRMGGKSAWESGPRPKPGSIAVIPAADETDDAKERPIKAKPEAAKGGEILGLCSPDPQALPTRTIKWAGQESFTSTDEPSRFFPEDARSDSSSTCAEDDDGNESSESASEVDRSDVNTADGVGEVMNYDEYIKEIAAAVRGQQSLTLENPPDLIRMQEAPSSAIDKDEQGVLPTEKFVAVPELINKPETEPAAAFVEKASQRTIRHNMAVFVVAIATFVLGMVVGVGVHGHLAAAALRAPSMAVTLYVEPTIESAAEPTPAAGKPGLDSDTQTRYLGRTAAASAAAAVGTLTSQFSPFGGRTASKVTKAVDEIDTQIQAVTRTTRIAREIIEEVQNAWIEVTSTTAEGAPVPGLLDGPGPGAPDLVDAHGPSPPTLIALHTPVGWFAKSLDRLTRNHRAGFEGLIQGPWV